MVQLKPPAWLWTSGKICLKEAGVVLPLMLERGETSVLQQTLILCRAEQCDTRQTHLDCGVFVVPMSFRQFRTFIFAVGCCPNNVQGRSDLAIF